MALKSTTTSDQHCLVHQRATFRSRRCSVFHEIRSYKQLHVLQKRQFLAQASVVSPEIQQESLAERIESTSGALPAQPKITGDTVVITGGSQGVGRATALLFAKNGYNVVIAARNPEKLKAAEAVLAGAVTGGRVCSAVPTDITDEQSVARLVDDVTARYECVSVLINCAGVCLSGTLESTSISDYVDQMNVNFIGAVTMTKGFQPALMAAAEKGKPVLVNVNSFGGRIPLRNMAAYTASKFALAGFTDAIRPEFADLGIHVAQVHPGVINSNFMERAGFRGPKGEQARAAMEKMLKEPPPGIVQTPEEVAAQVFAAVQGRKVEVMVGPAYNAINALYRSLGVNPFSVAPP